MKNLTTKLTIAAAALVAVAGTASAQAMEAKIPFAFRASGKTLSAGTYRVEMKTTPSSALQLVISSQDGKLEVLTMAYPNGSAANAWRNTGNPTLTFECGESRCALTDIWTGSSDPVYHIWNRGLGKDESTHTAEIVIHTVKAD